MQRLPWILSIRANLFLLVVYLFLPVLLGTSFVSAQTNYCTEHDETQWHPAVDPETGCWYGHEHGDNPVPAGTLFSPLVFGGDEATHHENIIKHNGYKIFYLHRNNSDPHQPNSDPCDDLRVRIHMDVTPFERRGQYHSFEAAVTHCSGGQQDVSEIQGWVDFGTTVSLSTREGGDNGVRPNKFVPSENEFNEHGLNIWEVWYGRTGLGLDMGWLVGGVPTVDHNGSDPDDPSTWVWTGGSGSVRKLENFNFYGWRDTRRGEFWTDPFGNTVDPNSQACQSQTQQCLRQYISPLFGTSQSSQIIVLYNPDTVYDATGVDFPDTHPLVGNMPWMDDGNNPEPPPEIPTGPAVFFDVDDSQGHMIDVNVRLIGVSGVYGVEAGCTVDPQVLQGTTLAKGDGFAEANSYYVDTGFQTDGTWQVAASLLRPNTPLEGDHLAFTFTYNVLTSGDGQLACEALAVDEDGKALAIEVVNGSIIITPPSEPPVIITEEPPVVLTGAIVGQAVYQNRPDNSGITVKLVGPNDMVFTEQVTGPDGTYTFQDIAVGEYAVQLLAPQHIPVVGNVVITNADETVQFEGELHAGDIDDNGMIDIQDVTLVGANFGLEVIPEIGHVDLNIDGQINISDLSLVGGNLDLVSPIPVAAP